MIDIDESFKLLNIYFEITLSVKESVFAVDSGDAKIINNVDGEERMYRVNSDDRCKSLIEIQFSFL